jgi:methylmalonyl-CoA mutase cobalamin-binding domain/chain
MFKPKNKIRVVTAASLFDGHDAAINIMRRIMQSNGAEVIHLGHDRSVTDVVDCAIQEDANAIAMTSYQGGHVEYLKYMFDLLKEKGCGHIKIFAGGGGVILPTEIAELQAYGITKIYSPDDGRAMGLEGMIIDLLQKSDFPTGNQLNGELGHIQDKNPRDIGRLISAAENFSDLPETISMLHNISEQAAKSKTPVLGITGTGGSGKSSLVDEMVRRFLLDYPTKNIGIISVDPSKRKTGGALLGDRIRMNAIRNERVYMRSMATRQSNLAVSRYIHDAVNILKAAHFDLIILETSGIGQSDTQITEHCDLSMYVMTPEYGAATQLEKIDMLDFADIVAVNKFDKRGAMDAVRDVKKQYQRNHKLFEQDADTMPVFGSIASQFNDPGTNTLYRALMDKIVERTGADLQSNFKASDELSEKIFIIPPARTRYLSEIAENNRAYDKRSKEQAAVAQKLFGVRKTIETIEASSIEDKDRLVKQLEEVYQKLTLDIDPKNLELLKNWEAKKRQYQDEYYSFKVRDKEIKIKTHSESLSHSQIPKVAVPKFEAWGEILQWALSENFPGEFPYASGIYPFKREGEDPTRMFAGEGGPERTNKRFHYVSKGLPAARLSTAFDSVTLYGQDPDHRPDIYGKIGNSGVSVPSLDDAKKLYSGFNLADPKTSVSMTINGPAPTITAFFMNAAIDQQCELYIKANGLEDEVNAKIDAIYKDKGLPRPYYKPYTATPSPSEGGETESADEYNLINGLSSADKLIYDKLKIFVQEMRNTPTEAEAIMWDVLRGKQLDGQKFRRQHVLGKYIADFVSLKNRLVVEIDGSIHQLPEVEDNDAVRTNWLNEKGFKVIRFTNDEVLKNTEAVLEKISKALLDAEAHLSSDSDVDLHASSPSGRSGGATLPEGNNGLGLMLLGVTGDMVLPADVYAKIKADTLKAVRGTVQADILKEDQAQNTCIFSTEFSLRVMGDVQQYFINEGVRNFYSVSISGYHIAEAGANPISQLAFTISNGFTFVEYYLSRGMHIDDFAPNLSFFFSNGIDPEYSVIGRVARRIWAKAMKLKYGGNERSQMLKYHIQTSGRSLHAQEIDFNDIRTTLQALYAIYDNCNSLHTNAYDEAITTPTEESVRRAMAIQLIINKELGLAKNENPLQGSFIIEELTDLVEEAVLQEFDRISERGGVLGAMETMYQRSKIQEESLYYETLKHTGEFPIIGVNTFLSSKGSPTIVPSEVIRSTTEEKEFQISNVQNLWKRSGDQGEVALRRLQQASIHNENIFAELMETVKYCSLGQITQALFEVGGQYRRNM